MLNAQCSPVLLNRCTGPGIIRSRSQQARETAKQGPRKSRSSRVSRDTSTCWRCSSTSQPSLRSLNSILSPKGHHLRIGREAWSRELSRARLAAQPTRSRSSRSSRRLEWPAKIRASLNHLLWLIEMGMPWSINQLYYREEISKMLKEVPSWPRPTSRRNPNLLQLRVEVLKMLPRINPSTDRLSWVYH